MAILARYVPRNLTVQVTNVLTTSDNRKIVCIATIDGSEPFVSWTHGGWSYSNATSVHADSLREIRSVDELPAGCPHTTTVLVGDRIDHPGDVPDFTLRLVCTDCGEEVPEVDARDCGDLAELDFIPV